jgi:chemotaxis protein methyltransferase CheR
MPVETGGSQVNVDAASTPQDPVFGQIRDVIYQVSGIFQADGRLFLLAAACDRRMRKINIQTPREYLGMITAKSTRDAELSELLNEITIGGSCLFRSMPQVDALRKVILPELIKDNRRQFAKRIRFWSAGCSTGEEPYTLAISVLEETSGPLQGWNVEILATDMNDRSIETAKTGIYSDYALRFTPELCRRKYFQPVGDGTKLQVRDEVKQLIAFSSINLRDDSRMLLMKEIDLIYCCNVLIYFDGDSKSRVLEHFYNSLTPGGYMFLGVCESLFRVNKAFRQVHFPGTIGYWKGLPGKESP